MASAPLWFSFSEALIPPSSLRRLSASWRARSLPWRQVASSCWRSSSPDSFWLSSSRSSVSCWISALSCATVGGLGLVFWAAAAGTMQIQAAKVQERVVRIGFPPSVGRSAPQTGLAAS